MSYSTRGGSGGGGFGGFPYRGSHQQGNNDRQNNPNNSNRPSRKRNNNRKKRGGVITCEARFQIPPSCRRHLIGPNGSIIKAITNTTKCIVNVPGKNQVDNALAMVQIQASCIDYLLHGCWEVLNIVAFHYSDDDDVGASEIDNEHHQSAHKRYMEINYRLETGGLSFRGNQVNSNGAFIVGTTAESGEIMSVYCIPTNQNQIDEDGVSILVDNERFVDPNITARVAVALRSDISTDFLTLANSDDHQTRKSHNLCTESNLLILIYGSEQDKTKELYQKILHNVQQTVKEGKMDQTSR